MDTTGALDTALSQERVIFFLAVRIDAKGGTVRLLDGGGEVTIAGDGTYKGVDPVWGTLENIDNISDGMDEQAPQLSMTFFPDASADIATIADPDQQGKRVRIYLGALNTATKAVVADPYLLMDGAIDVPHLIVDDSARAVDFDVVSSFEKLFMDDEGSRLNPTCHKDVWPGETGLDAITGVVRQVIWGPGDKISGAAPGSVGVGSPPGSGGTWTGSVGGSAGTGGGFQSGGPGGGHFLPMPNLD